jgi:hypothetical protein
MTRSQSYGKGWRNSRISHNFFDTITTITNLDPERMKHAHSPVTLIYSTGATESIVSILKAATANSMRFIHKSIDSMGKNEGMLSGYQIM